MSKKIAVLEVEFDTEIMYDEQEAISDHGSYLKAMQWVYGEEDMGIFSERLKLVAIKDVNVTQQANPQASEELRIAIRHEVNDAFQYGEETKGLADYKTINAALNLTTDQILTLINQEVQKALSMVEKTAPKLDKIITKEYNDGFADASIAWRTALNKIKEQYKVKGSL